MHQAHEPGHVVAGNPGNWYCSDRASGNGTDQGTIIAMLGEVLTQVSKLDSRIGMLESRIERLESKVEHFGYELDRLRSDMNREFAKVRAEIRSDHSAVIGHGIAITELEEQLGRLSDHAGLPWRSSR